MTLKEAEKMATSTGNVNNQQLLQICQVLLLEIEDLKERLKDAERYIELHS